MSHKVLAFMPKEFWKVTPRNSKIFTFWVASKTLTEPHSWFKVSNGHKNFYGKPFGCFLFGPKNFRPTRTSNQHFRRPKLLNPQKMWKYQDFTQNGRKFQVCHLGVNTHSRPFSFIFPKTNDSGENVFRVPTPFLYAVFTKWRKSRFSTKNRFWP